MQIGLFGKLPANGDFVSRALPAAVLQPWESWLNRVTSGARHHLGERWDDIYAAAPVWRFWLGELLFGQSVAGAIVPSVDKVGRQFPLCLILCDAGGDHPAPPVVDAGNERWYARLDAALLELRSDGFDGNIDGLLSQLPLPAGSPQPLVEDKRQAFFAYGEEGLAHLLRDVGTHDHQLAAASRSYWWTAGNTRVGPALLAMNDMPDAAGFAAMLVGFGPPSKVAQAETKSLLEEAPADPVEPMPDPVDDEQDVEVPENAAWAVDPSIDPVPKRGDTRPLAEPPDSSQLQVAEPVTPSDAPVDVGNPFDTEAGWSLSAQKKADISAASGDAAKTDDETDKILQSVRQTMSEAEPSDAVPTTPPYVRDLQDHDEDSPFGSLDPKRGLGAGKGPGLRGIFALRNRGPEGKD
ncbi:type VI secretion system-associated protein TagF [Actibacterium sp. 188UL27-1]|uniref:type VI secretion system-associated protein TagF n=1 Tax=Actibacterium sp. 188UL27-1 TaxID=2786961 RepID=UPI00195AC18D|nr:type VI secretion system-associated protein TagF [Actibacterium sp. 188UL27-1]MBM7068839.1 type VI secretion system-associated protein TagF [Actibacterium sp. 188UL27-1]